MDWKLEEGDDVIAEVPGDGQWPEIYYRGRLGKSLGKGAASVFMIHDYNEGAMPFHQDYIRPADSFRNWVKKVRKEANCDTGGSRAD